MNIDRGLVIMEGANIDLRDVVISFGSGNVCIINGREHRQEPLSTAEDVQRVDKDGNIVMHGNVEIKNRRLDRTDQ